MRREELSSFFSEKFICKKNIDVQKFLWDKAIRFEESDKSRTYLIISSDELNNDRLEIYGYFSLAIKSIELDGSISKNKRKKLDGISNDAEKINTYLIGQLAKNDLYKNKISGTEIIEYSLAIIKDCMNKVGGRVILVECSDNEKLIEFYKNEQFSVLQKELDNDKMIQLTRVLK